MDLRDNLAANLRRIRHERGLSQEDFAAEADIHRTYLTHLEGRRRNPSIAVVQRMMAALKVDVLDLLGEPPRKK